MKVALFGLGKMGAQIARRLHAHNVPVSAWNRSETPRREFESFGGTVFSSVDDLANSMIDSPRIFWLMLPHKVVDDFLFNQALLGSHLKAGDIVIDGGNSFYKDSMRRADELSKKGVIFYDCGTSGGVWGEQNGFALMVGGPKEHWNVVEPIFKILSAGENYGLVGPSGAGHFVKMVHNGIEYGMMEAIGEGYGIMQASPFHLDLRLVTKIYQQGSVVRSWLIDLTRDIFEKEDIAGTAGVIEATGEGEWTAQAAREFGVDARVIEESLQVRRESADPKNQTKFSNKIVALLRKQFGGHGITKQ